MSAGLKEVFREEMEEVGVCRDRILERVERNFRLNLCGRMTGKEGHERGNLLLVKNRWEASSPPREK